MDDQSPGRRAALPQVPTEPKTIPGIAISRSALGVTMMALFPPSSRMVLPSREATRSATYLPIRVDPVAEIRE